MILQSLNQLYERLQSEEDYNLPTPGYSVQNITFRIVLNPDGSLHNIEDARRTITETSKSGKTKTRQVAQQMLVPGEGKPPGAGINPCTLWDNTAYLLGYRKPDKNAAKAETEAARALETFEATRQHYLQLAKEIPDPDCQAICNFYSAHWTPEKAVDWKVQLDDFAATGFGIFRVRPNLHDFHTSPSVQSWWASKSTSPASSDFIATCLVTGEAAPIARIAEPAIKGVNGAAPGGAKLASFNLNAFESYRKSQTYNSPVSASVTFRYCNALNALLSGPQSHRHRVTIGDVTTVFWTEKKSATESLFAQFLGGDIESAEIEPRTLEDQTLMLRLKAFLGILRRGGGASLADLGDNPATKFYILGLSGNVTRLVVRFWHVGTIAEMLGRLADHFEALRIVKSYDTDPELPSAIRLLDQTAPFRNGKFERKSISPLLGSQLMLSILEGTPYPVTLVQGVLSRIRSNESISYLKASILKAYLTRNQHMTMTEELDPTRTEPAYHLGRLFAVYETAQKHAHDWKLDRTIRESMYSAASATPLSVFGRLERLHHHHTAKKSHPPGSSASYAEIVEEISQHFKGQSPIYPAVLDIVQQSLFAVGYYHQLHAFRSLSNSRNSATN